jgi:hypothetical protein
LNSKGGSCSAGATMMTAARTTQALSVGPFAISTATADLPVAYVPASEAESLCGERLDWIEALGDLT